MMNTCQHPDGCARPVKAHGWCRTHADRIAKSGDPGTAQIAPRQPASRLCAAEDCGEPVTQKGGHGYCSKHYQRLRRHGSPDVVAQGGCSLIGALNPNWSEQPSYNAVHIRLRETLGRASDQRCVDCGGAAAHWSYDNGDATEMADPVEGRYSINSAHYAPRCVPCHSRFDRAARALLLTGARP